MTLYDPDPQRCRATADLLRRELRKPLFRGLRGGAVSANVTEVACYLEITRQGYGDRVPVLEVDGTPVSYGLVLKREHAERFVAWLAARAEKEDEGGA
ncbi:hypothetical protein [Oleidesulfovibrio sp.]|uniref:hypothetical protein n=1 Tax=Oleidesulfovibrio sp. TaxID=2909707 RepID=UPI003A8B9E1A